MSGSGLRLALLGPFRATLDGERLAKFRTIHVQALLAYLATEHVLAPGPQRREALAELLWPGMPSDSGRANLRQILYYLRQTVDGSEAPDFLLSDRHTVQVNSDYPLTVDLARFSELMTGPVADQSSAVALYRGDFLADFYLPDAAPFEEWAAARRAHFRRQMLDALDALAGHFISQDAFDRAEPHIHRQLELDNLREGAYRQLMRLYARTGRQAEALSVYEQCVEVLQTELDAPPSEATSALAQAIRAGELPLAEGVVVAPVSVPSGPPPPSPYRGLQAFRQEDAPFFFGREAFTQRLVQAVQDQPLAAVIAPSGSGKSSVLQAGLMAALAEQGGWVSAYLRPGGQPFQALAAALLPLLEPDLSETDRLVETRKLATALATGDLPLTDVVGRISHKHERARVLLVVDQFEELFSLSGQDRAFTAFQDLLVQAVAARQEQDRPALALVLAIRVDFLGQVVTERALADLFQDATHILGPLSEAELQHVVERPAALRDVHLEEGLVQRIVRDVGARHGNLPLLQFALDALWQRQLTHSAYEAIGRVEGALAEHAEATFANLDPGQQTDARRLLVQLVQPGRGTGDSRRIAVRAELTDEEWGLAQQLADARLVVVGRDSSDRETAELVHEALIAHWGRLHGWLDEDRAFRLWQERLRAALSQWRTSERDEGALLRGAPLVEAEGWLASHRRRLSDDECAFVDASAAVRARRRQEREQARLARERQRRRIAIGLAVGLVIALGLAGLAAWQWNRARRTVDELQVERGRTQTALANALANQALAELDRQRDFALLLSVEAVQRADTTVALDSLLTALDDSRYLQRFLHGAQDDVRTIAYHPDGDRLVSGDAAGNIILWNIVTGARLGDSIDGHDDQLAEVAFSPDGSQLASAGFDDVVVLWDLTAEEPAQLARLNHPDNVWAVAFSPDGQTLATAAADGAVRLWSAAGDPLEGTWPRFASQATTVTFSPDGRLLAAGDGDGTIVLWDLEAAGPIGPPPSVHTGLVRDLAFSPDGHWLASASHDQTIILWDVAASEPIGQPLTAHDDWVTGVSFSPAGNRLASSSRDGRLRIWTLDAWLRSSGQETPILVQTFGGTDSPLWTVVFGPKTDTLVSAGSSGFLTLWDLTAPSPWVDRTVALNIDETMMPVEDRLFIDVAFSPKNDTVAVAAVSEVLRPDTDGLVFLAEMSSQKGSKVTLRQPGESILTIAFGPDGHRLLSGGRYGSLQLWDVDPESATFGQSLDDPLVGRVSNVTDVVFHPNGELAATFDGRVSVWDLSAKEMVIPPLSTSARDGAVIFSPDGSLLASTSGLGGVSIWDLEHDELTSVSISDQGSPLIRLAIAGGGAFLATSNDTGRVNLWDLVDNQPLTSFDLQTNPFWDMKLSLDGRLLAALSLTYELSFWEPWTGQRIGPWLSGESQRSQALQLSPDGRQLAVVSSPEGIITLWDFDPQSWQEKACQRANRNLTQEEWQRLFGQEPYRPTCPDLPAAAAGS